MKLIEIPPQTPVQEIDEEILEIFAEEVGEVLNEIEEGFAAWQDNPNNIEALKTLRRNFHTLKGSGRLVGATAIGELGWRYENMLNRVLEGTLTRNENMLKLIAQVSTVLPDMVEQFKHDQPPPPPVIVLISQVEHFTQTKGASIGELDSAVAAAPPQKTVFPNKNPQNPPPTATNNKAPTPTPAPVQKDRMPDLQLPDELLGEEMEAGIESVGLDADSIPELTDLEPLQMADSIGENAVDLNTPDLDWLETELPSLDVTAISSPATAATDSPLSTTPEEDITAWSATDLPEFEEETEQQATELIENIDALEPESLPDLLGDDDMNAFINQPMELTPSLAEESPQVFTQEDEETQLRNELFGIFKNEAAEHLATLKQFIHHYQQHPDITLTSEIVRAFHTLNGSSRTVEFDSISAIAAPLEKYTRYLTDQQAEVDSSFIKLLQESVNAIEDCLVKKNHVNKQYAPLVAEINAVVKSLAAEDSAQIPSIKYDLMTSSATTLPSSTTPTVAGANTSATKNTVAVPDPTDEFMVIFLEEAEEILENTQSLVERWQGNPHNMQVMKELQRELHTLKGGSRMVGIVAMGDLSHHLESVLTRIVEGGAQFSKPLQDLVQRSVDELASMLEMVRNSVPLAIPADLIAQINRLVDNDNSVGFQSSTSETLPVAADAKAVVTPVADAGRASTKSTPTTVEEDKAEKADRDSDVGDTEDRIRVRVTLIDKLTNLVGELSISRAHMEQQQGGLKNVLAEMEQTIIRLRDQLRRLDIETEVQIISHFRENIDTAPTEEFDPLEMDRFSDMQQISRSLMESISDLMSIQDQMKMLTRQSDSLLIQQSRIGAELQDGIMRTRMIPFSRISPRLQRIARLTARELHKQVDFVINGESIEFERTVLNRLVAPLEHLLRNAIGHGVEEPELRQQLGKSPVAKVVIDLLKEGTELIVRLSDDGAGLNLLAIRKKAEERRMITVDTVISDTELMKFILEPSFSTAQKITQVSGRGVGMDVVNSEIKQLNGSLRIHSETGKGATFEVRLPLSLTINQALMVQVGEDTMAIPLTNVDAVLRAPRAEMMKETGEPVFYRYMDKEYHVVYLNELLGFGRSGMTERKLVPTLLIRAAERRIALLVDKIEGSREIVVKSVGSQIGAIRWLAGATVLGDGRVVLILDVPALMRADMLSYMEMKSQMAATNEPVVVKEEKSQKVPTIMVVDDSITVRKVTARLLKRQGMEVMTAKDGVDAFAQLQESIPDLMLLDVEMPRMDGYELASQVRNSPTLKDIPIIMITSRTGTKHRDRAEKIGINRYLGKPFNETELLENITSLLAEQTA